VGKTTVAATLALEGARRGRRCVVITIDPARRLGDALGLRTLSNNPSLVEGGWPGELWALMLDTKGTFDHLVETYARTPQQAAAILGNRFYKNLAGALSGTQEYMATEKLFELDASGDFDLIVVDTPPARNALDFIDAPRRLVRFLDNRLVRMLMMPARASLRAANLATQALLRTIARVVGSEVVSDAAAFFRAFEGMEAGFRDRADAVRSLLVDPATAFVMVASPRRDALAESRRFLASLARAEIAVSALVINRVHPTFAGATAARSRTRADELVGTALGDLYANLADFRQMAEGEAPHVEDLGRLVAPAAVVKVPFMASDVHDLAALGELARYVEAG